MPLSEHLYCVAISFKMTEQVEQQICKFCVKLEHSSTETVQMIQKAFRDDAIRVAQIKVWHKHFKDIQESVESHPRSGRPAQAEHLTMLGSTGCSEQRSGLSV